MNRKPLSVGLFGGTFDPPHIGHLIAAERVRDELALDEIWFIPSYRPPHKAEQGVSQAEDRLYMVELAIAAIPYFKVSTVEFEREGPSYTFDTVMALKERFPDYRFTFIVGEDALIGLKHWHRFQELYAAVDWAALLRPGYTLPQDESYLKKVRFVVMPLIDIASSRLREMVRLGSSIRFLVPEAVRRYIEERGLYMDRTADEESDEPHSKAVRSQEEANRS
ncbi:MAG: nicotinate-nucleotide adenylyltransferase [Candidatus Carbobacillus altaicus]|uniref:Probable nicotinate-nucleotide adenylyltransferase n=1 Tax=Candidatus Carbonibacillus altaicus TaxID=2163959 RepID=A0A2R6XXW0_9BACL|nr:nicotinate-nucleotide adenylyltransferase [Candidatus Carbobacillus altaicus]PTQ55253.1 MAG: Nicotinate-nucleotide adenylyltransferase [Candidatus Carbobacillus altaicus]